MGFQAWNRGIMLEAKGVNAAELVHKEGIDVADEYIFIRKFYKSHRVYYFLIKNILSFRNPVKELRAFSATSGIQKKI